MKKEPVYETNLQNVFKKLQTHNMCLLKKSEIKIINKNTKVRDKIFIANKKLGANQYYNCFSIVNIDT